MTYCFIKTYYQFKFYEFTEHSEESTLDSTWFDTSAESSIPKEIRIINLRTRLLRSKGDTCEKYKLDCLVKSKKRKSELL